MLLLGYLKLGRDTEEASLHMGCAEASPANDCSIKWNNER